MKKPMSFYVAYPKNSRLRECLNALKILADETQRTEAHITVRGPYKKRLPENFLEKYSKIISGEELNITQVDNFFAYNQNTVFYKCDDNPNLRKVWKKLTYNDFKPHITIYDGDDYDFAQKLFKVLSYNFTPFKYIVDDLDYLKPKNKNELKLYYLNSIFDFDFFEKSIEVEISRKSNQSFELNEKLLYIEQVANYLYSSYDEKLLPTKNIVHLADSAKNQNDSNK